MVVAALTMAFQNIYDQYCMNMVFNSKMINWPRDRTSEIMQELQVEFAHTNLLRDTEQQRELEAIYMKRNANLKMLFSQITAIENKYRGRMSALTEKNKLTNIILRAPEEYAQTIHTARQLTKGGNPPREPAVKELQTAIYEYCRARRTTRVKDQNNEMSLYARDDSDGDSTGSKRKSNK